MGVSIWHYSHCSLIIIVFHARSLITTGIRNLVANKLPASSLTVTYVHDPSTGSKQVTVAEICVCIRNNIILIGDQNID